MSSLRPIRTLTYHHPSLIRSLTSASATSSLKPLVRTPILSSIIAQRPSNVSPLPQLPATATAAFHTARMLRSAAAHGEEGESHYDPPSGWLFGIPPGEKYEREGWERIWVWGFWGSLGVAVVAYAYKPDTSIQTWALEEARRRLEAEGILPDPDDEKK